MTDHPPSGTGLEERISQLSDYQALAILDALSAEVSTQHTPARGDDQRQALESAFETAGQDVKLAELPEADPVLAAAGARRLLTLMGKIPAVRPSLDGWLEDPPTQETAAIPLVLALPVVLTGCIAFLQVIGHTHFERDAAGQWKISYDPAQRTPFDRTLRETVGVLADVVRGMGSG